jgi:hypothetical protein
VDGEDVREPDVRVERVERGREPVLVAYVVPGGEGVRRVEADAEVEAGAPLGNLAQVLEAVADALALPGRVLDEDSEGAEFEPFAGRLQTVGAGAEGVRLARAARAAGVDDEVVRAEREAALDLLAEGGDRLLADRVVRGGEVDKVVGVDGDRRDARLGARLLEERDLFGVERPGLPAARVAREYLHRVSAERTRLQERVVEPARYPRVEPDARSRRGRGGGYRFGGPVVDEDAQRAALLSVSSITRRTLPPRMPVTSSAV